MAIGEGNIEGGLATRQDNLESRAWQLWNTVDFKPPEPVPYSHGTLIKQETRGYTPLGQMDDETIASVGTDAFPEGYVPEKLAKVSLIFAVNHPDDPPERGRLATIKTDVYADQLGIPLESHRVPLLPTEPLAIGHVPVEDLARLSSQFRDEHLSDLDAVEQQLDTVLEEEGRIKEDSNLFA